MALPQALSNKYAERLARRHAAYCRSSRFTAHSREDWILRVPRSSSYWLPRNLSNHMDRQARTGSTVLVKGTGFFHESPSPKPLIITLGSFRIFSKIRKSRCTTGINDTGGKFCLQFPLCFWHRWQIIGTISGCRYLKVNLKAKIYIYVSSTTQRWPNKIITNFSDWRFFPFATGVVDTGGKPWAANISPNFRKNSKRPWCYNQRLGGNWYKKKTRSKISRDTVPLRIADKVGAKPGGRRGKDDRKLNLLAPLSHNIFIPWWPHFFAFVRTKW